jgi:hypothetical protein
MALCGCSATSALCRVQVRVGERKAGVGGEGGRQFDSVVVALLQPDPRHQLS